MFVNMRGLTRVYECTIAGSMRNKVAISLKLDPDRLARLDAFRNRLTGSPTRTGIIEAAIDEFIDRRDMETAPNVQEAKPLRKEIRRRAS